MVPIIELAAVAASALYGVLRGAREGFDIVGLFALASATAFGGGTLRDLFLDRQPLFWIEKEYYLWLVLALACLGAVTPRSIARIQGLLTVPDALGLGLFSVAGASVAVASGMSPLIAVVMGVVTGTAGGVICDVICNQTPTLFRSSPLCATCAALGAIVYVTVVAVGGPVPVAQWSGVATATVLRLLAVWRDWRLPVRKWLEP